MGGRAQLRINNAIARGTPFPITSQVKAKAGSKSSSDPVKKKKKTSNASTSGSLGGGSGKLG